MLTSEIASEFRRYMDEPDLTFVDEAQLAIWLERAYDDFRAIVIEIDPHIYAETVVTNLTAARRLDLTTLNMLGTGATRPMYQLVDIYEIESIGLPDNIIGKLEPSVSLNSTYGARANYTLRGTDLYFDGEQSMSIRIDYVPAPTINWALTIAPGAGVHVDDLTRFHDIIALAAYLQYAIVDSANNEQLLPLLARRTEQLRAYLEGRSGGIVERVVDVRWM